MATSFSSKIGSEQKSLEAPEANIQIYAGPGEIKKTVEREKNIFFSLFPAE